LEREPLTQIRVKILGIEYPVAGDENAEHLQEVAKMVDQRMQVLVGLNKELSPLRTAILTALNLADEVLRMRKQLCDYQEEAAQYEQEITRRTRKLLDTCSQIPLIES
jgi:cell division protein ZapA